MKRFGTVLTICLVLVAGQALAAVKTLTGVELAQFNGRDVLVLRTTGDIPAPSGYQRNAPDRQVSFLLNGAAVGSAGTAAAKLSGRLITAVKASETADGAVVTVTLASGDLADPACFRFSSPSSHLVLMEVFPRKDDLEQARPLTGDALDQWLSGVSVPHPLQPAAQPPAGAPPAAGQPSAAPAPRPAPAKPADSGSAFAQQLGIPSLDLRHADPQRVLGLAADAGLLNLRGTASVSTEGWGSIAVKPGGQSLASWSPDTPPGEIYLAGTPEQIAKFMQYADPRFVGAQPTLVDEWAKARPQAASKPVLGGRSAATRMRLKDDPADGLYYSDYQPGGVHLSDIMVTLDASQGLNLYDVLNYLSQISGISLLIDPYAFDDPTGSKRQSLPPDAGKGQGSQPGFRQADRFNGGGMGSGTVRGNFVNVPFDQFLQMVLKTHDLAYTIRTGGSSDSGYGDTSRGPGQGTGDDSYQKPVILVTSPERLNYELDGTNNIDLYQFNYADPQQVQQLVQQFGLMPDVNAGWYIYQGNGNGTGIGQGQGGGGNNGRSGGIGGNGGGRTASAKPDVLVYRGGSRQPVEQAVQNALAAGQSVVRVALSPEQGDQLVTLFASSRPQ
jgi:hypothetical protein